MQSHTSWNDLQDLHETVLTVLYLTYMLNLEPSTQIRCYCTVYHISDVELCLGERVQEQFRLL